jgi:hypothetical protein
VSHTWRRLLGLTSLLLFTGCATQSTDLFATSPSATSQLLVFRSLERAVARLDMAPLQGRRVKLEIVSQLYDHKFAATYVETWLRTHGVKVGDDEPDLRLQVFVITLGTDHGQSFIGLPSFQVPVLAIPVPEIAIFKWIRNRGRADLRAFAFDPKTADLVDLFPETTGRAKYDDFTLLVVIGFSVTDTNDSLPASPPAGEP